ncbi:uncharacterized protein C3orf20 homolog [Podarcis raffonei]|uniref:uncharacterized protein C3orf20 homolog n=1 Tax=Podarcis raffonei TaxID=65483 RepID=UPI0023296390|nr:uncharacterized protein C3orf20 homolog [Podarcis raffonei]XP_053234031.1 uncharacterized protein C3orf20 homolog [Podarcis raffonei]XP_053234032.1 uncharacterized protein C3orf20 homolog [Podarcis raffonei]XP_053234033.1 uncharacterized protein C3orf20 homolog [Podarcis raffonei]
MNDPKPDTKTDQRGDSKGSSKGDQKTDHKGDQKADQKPSPRASPVKSVDYAQIKAKAPRVLADMVQMLILWRKMGFHVPRGVKNIFEFTWDELLVTPPRKSFAGLYCPVVKFASTEDADISSTPTSRAQKVGPTPSRLKANYVTPSSEDQQMLLKFQKRSVHLLTELLKMKMKLMIEAAAGPSVEEIARRFLEGGQNLIPKTREDAAEFTPKEPRRRGRGMAPILPAIPISSTTQLIQQMSMNCLCFQLSMKDTKQQKSTGKAYDERLDPCPEARELLREICRTIAEERNAAITKGHTRPLILRNYMTIHRSPSQALKRASVSLIATEVRRMKGKKFFFSFPDGTSLMFYPSGSVAVYQFPICCIGKTITLLFQDAPSQTLLGTITSQGHSWIRYCFKASCSIALMMNNEGGSIRDKDGYLTQHWSWYSKNQILQSLDYQINEQLKLKVVNQNSMTITFTEQSESITLSLVREGCTHRSKSDRQPTGKSTDSGDQEGQWVRALTEIKKRFEKIVRQFINGILMVSGICCVEYPIDLAPSKQVKFLIKDPVLLAWDRVDTRPLAAKRRSVVKPYLTRNLAFDKPFRGKYRPPSRSKAEVSAAKDAVRPPEPWAINLADCPVVLHKIMSKVGDDLCCRCVVKIPLITDLEFEKFITAPRDPDQVIVICVISPQDHSYSPFFEWSIENLYIQMQHGRPSPCIQCKHDPFRFLRYDLECPLNKNPPLLVQKHAVVPGMVVMYAGGKPVFGGCVFNGYSFSKKDLLKQINQVCLDCKMGHFLPQSFKFSPTFEDPKKVSVPALESFYSEPLPLEEPVCEQQKETEKSKRGKKKSKK